VKDGDHQVQAAAAQTHRARRERMTASHVGIVAGEVMVACSKVAGTGHHACMVGVPSAPWRQADNYDRGW